MSDKRVVRGSIYELKQKCPRRNCACATGKPHVSLALSITMRQRKGLTLIPKRRIA